MGSQEDQLLEIIRQRCADGAGVVVGIGDDAAVVTPSPGAALVCCTDTLVSGVHFPKQTSARDIGYKSLAVNLSDLAAMGASPRWALLALTMPHGDSQWLEEFLDGLQELAQEFGVTLIGGDLSAGPLVVSVQCLGELAGKSALRRGTGEAGDLIAVSGSLGRAAYALQCLKDGVTCDDALAKALNRPQPRVQLGQALTGFASSAIDISDGLLLDLERLLAASGLGADIRLTNLPVDAVLEQLSDEKSWSFCLSGGDEYELLFSLPPARRGDLERLAQALGIRLTVIGDISSAPGIRCLRPDGGLYKPQAAGYQHFSDCEAE